ncbi:hypothetical protein [Caldalkalibacillus mannanilyticus]|uniref:hypothetical protein n=1 Tax=Caldalkalibacillus mannanilyticus TaxID=1418 RepID=UPI0004690405|nr:hypothetical protein [Caldalkalibacillus mannanilyticus]
MKRSVKILLILLSGSLLLASCLLFFLGIQSLLSIQIGVQEEHQNLTWTENIYFDNDSQRYVYSGTWTWDQLTASEPYDLIGVTTNAKEKLPISEVMIKGYDEEGKLTAFYSTITGERSGAIQLATPPTNPEGIAFWIDESLVRRGNVTVFLDSYTGANDKEKVYLQYQQIHPESAFSTKSVVVKEGGGFHFDFNQEMPRISSYTSPGSTR